LEALARGLLRRTEGEQDHGGRRRTERRASRIESAVTVGRVAGAIGNAVHLFAQAVAGWWRDDGLRLGAALSYYTVFSLAPVLILSVAVAGLVFGAEAASGRIVAQLRNLMGPDGAQLIQTLIERAAMRRSEGWAASVFGVATILFGASGAFGELQHAMNAIWNVPPRNTTWLRLLRTRLLSFSMVLAIGFLLLVSLVLSAALAALDDLAASLGPLQPVLTAVNAVVSFGVVATLFALIFRVLPDERIPWRDIWPGAAAAALLFVAGKFAIAFYIGNTAVASVYGAASSLAVLLLWVYYSAQSLFIGAELSQVLCRRRRVCA
jgi:membrane protein